MDTNSVKILLVGILLGAVLLKPIWSLLKKLYQWYRRRYTVLRYASARIGKLQLLTLLEKGARRIILSEKSNSKKVWIKVSPDTFGTSFWIGYFTTTYPERKRAYYSARLTLKSIRKYADYRNHAALMFSVGAVDSTFSSCKQGHADESSMLKRIGFNAT
ncbi:hypothetical protein HN803_07975 [candidate division WWE3 bacterium]|nr:hypothetical protein [candidate division WWE3 bacterium]MBT7350690.1 hypothetical protein [candidate division WWE3 bacterium]